MKNDIGKSIKFYRESLHWSQNKLAEQPGVSQRNVSYYESGDRIPPADVLKNIYFVQCSCRCTTRIKKDEFWIKRLL